MSEALSSLLTYFPQQDSVHYLSHTSSRLQPCSWKLHTKRRMHINAFYICMLFSRSASTCASVCSLAVRFSAWACERQINIPDVLMIVAMATSLSSKQKMSRVRAEGEERGEWVKRGWTGELGGQNRIYFSWGSCCDGWSSRIQSNIFWLKVPRLILIMTGVVNQPQIQCGV